MRKSGILMPVFSLPSLYGIGCFGKDAYHFVDFLEKAGQSYWQILPLGPPGYGDSPYQCYSGTAGNPLYIDVELLMFDGLVDFEDCREFCGTLPEREVDYDRVRASREKILRIAASRFDSSAAEFLAFCEENASWLRDYAVFMSLKKKFDGASCWEWPEEFRSAHATGVAQMERDEAEEIRYQKILQYLFYKQWTALKTYANEHGVEIIGDIPIYVSRDSSDFWASPELFLLDEEGEPSFVAGCPPDYFSADGQLWGNPIYDWERQARTGFAWWIDRLRCCEKLFDVVRIDHFRGLHDFWSVPSDAKSAAEGQWNDGPDRAFVDAVRRELPELRLIAEDLGALTKGVHELLAYSGYPGMRVLQFAFDGHPDNQYLPYSHEKNTVVYTATHDNATTREWWEALDNGARESVRRYFRMRADDDPVETLIAAALSSVADTAIVPLFDWLGEGAQGRINTPSTVGGNWRARIPYDRISDALAAHIGALCTLYGRTQGGIGND